MKFHYRRPLYQDQPPKEPLPPYAQASELWGDVYVRYPGSQQPISTHHAQGVRAVCGLRAIMADIVRTTYHSNRNLSLEQAMEYRQYFLAWFQGLPQPLTPYYIVFPPQLELQ